MKIGLPKEVKNNEFRVGLTPDSVGELSLNHDVFVDKNAGKAIGFTDEMYQANGAQILKDASSVFDESDLIVKVKEPLPEENQFLSSKHTLFTYLHLAGNKANAKGLINTGVHGVAYETVTSDDGGLPLLAPMSKIAGRISLVVGQYFLLKPNKGIGTLFGRFENIQAREVSVVGAGVAGKEAIRKGIDSGAHVNVLDISSQKLKDLEKEAPKVITREMLKVMKPGSVFVDISIDQGGCIETSKPTTHDDPIFVEEEVVHYCVTNMPGAVPLTASLALNHATLPFIKKIADLGLEKACASDNHLANGLNMANGEIRHPSLESALNS